MAYPDTAGELIREVILNPIQDSGDVLERLTAVAAGLGEVAEALSLVAAGGSGSPIDLTALLANINGRLSKASNLSDLTDPVAAKGNLGLDQVTNTSDAQKVASGPIADALATKLQTSTLVAAIETIAGSLPTAPDGLGAGKLWKQGDASGGYTFAITGTNT